MGTQIRRRLGKKFFETFGKKEIRALGKISRNILGVGVYAHGVKVRFWSRSTCSWSRGTYSRTSKSTCS